TDGVSQTILAAQRFLDEARDAGYDGVQLLFSQFSIKLNSKKIETEGRYLDTDANAMCQYLEGKQYAHPVSSDKFAITGKDEKEVAQNHLAYLMDNGIVQKNSAGKYSVSDVAAFQAYLFNAANGKIKELNGTDNPYMVLHRGVSLGFSPKIQLEISTISAQVNGKPGGQVEVPGSVEIIMPDKSALDRTGPQWQEKMPVTAGVYQGKDKVADAIFDRGSGKFIIRGLKTGDYNLVAFAQMNGLKTAQVTVPIKISGLVSPAHISIADPATKTVTFKADIGSDINAQIKANGNVYYSFGTFEKEGGQWVADIYDKDANLLGKAQVLDSQGKTVTGNILENSGIYYKGVKIGSSILKGADMEPSFALDEETGKTLAFMEENGLVKKVPVQNGTSSITVEQGNNLFPRNPSVSSAFMPETAKSP
ncbi:MAG TPA: hypothetical protein PLO51_00890, partial [Candidatus Micrarchaeota archaeon]|nr:hypothetical protein [Candidatus Micrarchaeota archaeon]